MLLLRVYQVSLVRGTSCSSSWERWMGVDCWIYRWHRRKFHCNHMFAVAFAHIYSNLCSANNEAACAPHFFMKMLPILHSYLLNFKNCFSVVKVFIRNEMIHSKQQKYIEYVLIKITMEPYRIFKVRLPKHTQTASCWQYTNEVKKCL